MKKLLFYLVEKIFFSIICALVPVRKSLILFGSGFNKFSDNPKFLFLLLQNNPRYTTVWISSSRTEVLEMRKCGYRCLYKWSVQAFLCVIRASIWIVSHKGSDIFPFIPNRTILINLWHGTPIKKIGYDSLKEREWIDKTINSGRKLPYERWDYFISASENTSFIFENAMRLPNTKVKPLGQPRTAPIYEASRNHDVKAGIEAKLDFINAVGDKRRILYTPTFRNNDLSTEEIKQSLIKVNKVLDKEKKQILLFKPHPLDKNIFNDLFFESLHNVINVSKEDTQNLLCVSDVLITDYSSIMFDYMITGKPIISYIFDFKDYVDECGGLYFSFEEIGTITATSFTELVELIQDQELNSGEYDKLKFNTMDSCIEIEKLINSLRED